MRQATRDVRRHQSDIVSIVQEGLGSIRVVKAFAQGGFEIQLAIHRPRGDGRDMGANTGHITQFIDTFLLDHRAVHVGDQQAFAPPLGWLD